MSDPTVASAKDILHQWCTQLEGKTDEKSVHLLKELLAIKIYIQCLEYGASMQHPRPVTLAYKCSIMKEQLRMSGHASCNAILQHSIEDVVSGVAKNLMQKAGNLGGFRISNDIHDVVIDYTVDVLPNPPNAPAYHRKLSAQEIYAELLKLTHS